MYNRLPEAQQALALAPVVVTINGKTVQCRAGDSVAAALLAAGVNECRDTAVKDVPRSVKWCVSHFGDALPDIRQPVRHFGDALPDIRQSVRHFGNALLRLFIHFTHLGNALGQPSKPSRHSATAPPNLPDPRRRGGIRQKVSGKRQKCRAATVPLLPLTFFVLPSPLRLAPLP